ncbi:MAG: hypothetical protein GEU90_21825 [Gemmatimonas sp.]|nr:hypothetical protein [Gemmatimonas sp.]
MLTAAWLDPVWHHSRAHRFFATARWSLDQVGLVMLGLVIGWLTATGAPLLIAVDDTLFRRSGKKVHGAVWAYDGSRQVTTGQAKLSKGVTFVVAAVVVELPFADRPIALPVLFRLWRPGGPNKSTPSAWPGQRRARVARKSSGERTRRLRPSGVGRAGE